jgi:hypothetical protein
MLMMMMMMMMMMMCDADDDDDHDDGDFTFAVLQGPRRMHDCHKPEVSRHQQGRPRARSSHAVSFHSDFGTRYNPNPTPNLNTQVRNPNYETVLQAALPPVLAGVQLSAPPPPTPSQVSLML